MSVGKTRMKNSTIYGRGIGVINSDHEVTLLFDEDAEIVRKDLIDDRELERDLTQSKAIKVTLDRQEYFIPLIEEIT